MLDMWHDLASRRTIGAQLVGDYPPASIQALRYPISADMIPDRKGFKFTGENVTMFLSQAKDKP
jgi:hypothetical protein